MTNFSGLEENDYERLGIEYYSPAKMIKKITKDIFDYNQSKFKKHNILNLEDFVQKIKDVNFEGDNIYNFKTYTKVLNLYLFYFSLYKKYGFTKDYFDKVKPISYTSKLPKIELESKDKNIILLRELPFFLEDYFKEEEKQVSTEIIYMFSFFYLYHLVDYEFLLSTNEFNLKQKKLFNRTRIFSYIFTYIIQRNHKDCLKKYVVNEEIIKLLEEENDCYNKCIYKYYFPPFFNYLIDRETVEEVMKKGFDNFSYDKHIGTFYDNLTANTISFIRKNIENSKVPIEDLCKEIISKILREKIVYLLGDGYNFFDILYFSSLE